MRLALDELLDRKVSDPGLNITSSPVIDAILMLLVTEGIAVPDMDVVRASASTITNKPGSKPGGNITHIHKRGGDSTHKHKGGHQQQKHGNQKRKGGQKRQS